MLSLRYNLKTRLNQKVNLIIENVLTRAVINIYLIIIYFILSLIYIV